MSASVLYHTNGINDVQYKATRYEKGSVIFEAEMKKGCHLCPRCKNLHSYVKEHKHRNKLARSLLSHWEGLITYFDHRISNGITEGINNKIKTLKRQAYGYRDMEYFKLRLYHLHEQKSSLTG